MDTRVCVVCGEVKPLNDFSGDKNCRDGRRNSCKICVCERVKKRYRENEHVRQRAIDLQRERNSTKSGRIKYVLGTTKQRKEIENDLTLDQVSDLWEQQQGMCAISGVPLGTEIGSPFAASLDRIDSSKSYTLSNMQWVCWKVNEMKMDNPLYEFLWFVRQIAEYNKTADHLVTRPLTRPHGKY